MSGDMTRINLSEAAEAVRDFLEDEVAYHQELVDELTARNRGILRDYTSRHRGLWSRMLGRLRESGMDSPEAIIGSAAVIVLGAAVSVAVRSRKR